MDVRDALRKSRRLVLGQAHGFDRYNPEAGFMNAA